MTTLTARQTRRLESDLLKQRREVLAEAHDEMMQAIERSYADVAGDVPDFGDQAAAASLCGQVAHERTYAVGATPSL